MINIYNCAILKTDDETDYISDCGPFLDEMEFDEEG